MGTDAAARPAGPVYATGDLGGSGDSASSGTHVTGAIRSYRAPRAVSFSAPSMGINLEVKVLSEIDHSDRSEPQGRDREEPSGGSGERSRGPTYRNRI